MSKGRGGHGHGTEQGSHERWLITYADMITLLMAFFIMMYAMSILNVDKFRQLAVSVRSGFGGDVPQSMYDALGVFDQAGASSGTDATPAITDSLQLVSQVSNTLRKGLTALDRGNVAVSSTGGQVTIRVKSDDVLFARGSADISPRARATLHAIAQAVGHLPYSLRVEGHTCNLPIHSARFPSNWELSSERAINVVTALIRQDGLAPARLSAVGFADTRPLAPNTCEENRVQNRRIDIILERSRAAPVRAQAAAPASEADDIRPATVNIIGDELQVTTSLTAQKGPAAPRSGS